MNMVEGLELLTGKAPKPHEGRAMALEDGSRVAVIGAGPAGSMFSYFFLSMAETIGLDVKVDIFEPGCNHCGGIVSESLVQRLATEGIRLPDCVVQRGIESYTLHMDVGDVEIATPAMVRAHRNPWILKASTAICSIWQSKKALGSFPGSLPACGAKKIR
jgi:hypothetical protein